METTHYSIKDVDFGRLDAESDDKLADYFVDTGVLDRLRDGEKHYVIGRKGAGKTAIFKLANSTKLARPTVALNFTEYPWNAHRQVQEEGVARDSSYVASWRFTFLVNLLRYWSKQAPTSLKKEAAKQLNRIYGNDDPGAMEVLADKLKNLRKFELPNAESVGSLGAIEFAAASGGPVIAKSISRWNEILSGFVGDHYWECPVTLTLDGLDDGWDASEDSKMLLVGALKASRDINLRLKRTKETVPVLLFLRSDIYNELQFNDKNKINADIEYLE